MHKYMTIQGDTWDNIAYKELSECGGELCTSLLMDANQRHIHTVIFEAGVELVIPDVETRVSKSLPPWMRI